MNKFIKGSYLVLNISGKEYDELSDKLIKHADKTHIECGTGFSAEENIMLVEYKIKASSYVICELKLADLKTNHKGYKTQFQWQGKGDTL